MTHDSAVRTVVDLVPEIEKRGAAEVLTEYAHQEDLPPAQLEKLGQVYNTMRTVSHIDNAKEEERGATVPLLDVPVMVVGYATGADQEKAAAKPESFSSHDLRVLDLNKALKRELNGDPMQKAASDITVEAEPQKVEEQFNAQEKSAALDAALLDLEVDLEDEMAKLAGDIIGAAPTDSDNVFLRDVSDFEHDALRRQPKALVKLAGEYLEKYAKPLHIMLTRFDHDQPIEKYAYEIPHEQGEKFAALAEVAGTYDFITKFANATEEERREMLDSPDADITDILGAPPMEAEPQAEPQAEGDEAAPDPDDIAAAAEENGLVTDSTGQAGEDRRKPRGEKDEDEKSDKGGGKSEKGGEKGKGGGKNIGDLIAAPFAAVGAGIRGAAAKADETLKAVTTKERQNKPQRAVDIDVADIKRAMNLNRMIANDPDLREADPKEVLEVYNSVVARNPEMAGDMAALRLVLREAVSYEGLTLDSQKMLSEIRRNDAQGAAAAEENEKKRYAVGGASPIQIAKV